MFRRLLLWLMCFADDPNGGGADDPGTGDGGGDGGAGGDAGADGGGAGDQGAGAAPQPAGGKEPATVGADGGGSGDPAKTKPGPKSTMLDEITKALAPGGDANKGGKPAPKPDGKPGATTAGAPDPKTKAAAVDPKTGKPAAPPARQPLTAADLKAPDGLDPKSQARFTKLVTGYSELDKSFKELEAKHNVLEQHRTQFTELMTTHKVDGDSMAGFLDYNLAVKSGRFEDALRILDDQRSQLAKAMGKQIPGVDLFDDFPDIKKDVAEFKITAERAAELAKERRAAAARQADDEKRRQTEEAANNDKAEREQGARDIAAFALDRQKNDIDYPAKEAALLDELDSIMAQYPPNRWKAELERAYRLVRPAPGNGRPQPPGSSGALRPAGGSGQPEATTLLDAMFTKTGQVRAPG